MTTYSTLEHLDAIARMIADGDWGRAEPWGGAGIVITDTPPVSASTHWFSEPDYVITPYVSEVSWVFEQARDAVYHFDDYGLFKEEFFGRMGEAVTACGPDVPITTHLNVALFAARFFVSSVVSRVSHI